jgi:hypothetical protein
MVGMLFVLCHFWNREQREARQTNKVEEGTVHSVKSGV